MDAFWFMVDADLNCLSVAVVLAVYRQVRLLTVSYNDMVGVVSGFYMLLVPFDGREKGGSD
jgi:hypothetical protein